MFSSESLKKKVSLCLPNLTKFKLLPSLALGKKCIIKSNFGRLGFKQPSLFLKMLNRELVTTSFSLFSPPFFFFFLSSSAHANINSGATRPEAETFGAFIVEAGLANAISGEIKWERWGEREISIFYEPFPLLPLGPLRPSAPGRLPLSLIPFSKNVIRKSPFGLSAATLPSCAGWAARAHISALSSLFALAPSLSLSSVSLSAPSARPSHQPVVVCSEQPATLALEFKLAV